MSIVPLLNGADVIAMKTITKSLVVNCARQSKFKPVHFNQKRNFHASRPVQGPVMAATLYWVTKSCCWAGVGIASTAVVGGAIVSATATGGASVAVPLASASAGAGALGLGALKMGLGAAATQAPSIVGITLVASSPAIATIGVPLAATTLTGAAMGAAAASPIVAATIIPAAKMGTVALASGAAGGVGLVAGIEVASCNAFALGMLFPWF